MENTELLKQKPNVNDFDLKPFGYIHALTTYIDKIEKQLLQPDVIKTVCKKEECKHWNGLFNRCKMMNIECSKTVLYRFAAKR